MAHATRQPVGTPQSGTSFSSATWLVAEREMRAQVRTKGFWLTFGLIVLGIFAMTILPKVFGGGQPTVVAVGAGAEQVVSATELEARSAPDRAAAEELVHTGEVDAAVVPDTSGESPLDVRVVALSDPPDEIVAELSVSPPVDLLEPGDVSDELRGAVSFVFALIFFVFALGFGMAIAQSVVTEKQTRIVEILVATVPVRALLAGKIGGMSLLVFGQMAVLALVTPVALRAGEQGELLNLLASAMGWFVPFFILGFVLLAGLWAVAGAIVNRQEDLGSSTSVVMTLVMLPYVGVTFWYDNELALTIMSHVPFSAPVAMPLRLFAGDAAAWEPFVSLLVLAVTLLVCVLVAARLYAGSILQSGGKVGLRRAWANTD